MTLFYWMHGTADCRQCGTYNAVLSGNRSFTRMTSQSDWVNIWPCLFGVGGRVGAAGRCWFYKRFLSGQVNAQFHSHMEIASAKNTFPIYHSAIPSIYMWSIKVWNFGLIKENFRFGHFHEFGDNATCSNRLGPKVGVIDAYTMHMCICDRYWKIRYSFSKTWIHRIQYFVSAMGVEAGVVLKRFPAS